MTRAADLARLREMERAATPGPWVAGGSDGRQNGHIECYEDITGHGGKNIATVWDRGRKENRFFIAELRNQFPALADRLERMGAALRTWIEYAEETLPEQCAVEPCDYEAELCAECRHCGCINMKVNAARQALAEPAQGEKEK